VAPGREFASADDGDEPRLTFWERVKYTLVRPDDEPSDEEVARSERTLEETEDLVARATDKERAIGLIAAPVAAFISFAIIGADIDHDPAKGTKNYVSPSLYHELLGVLLVLAVLMLLTALWRKRLFLGIVLALYGLAVFNLRYWGFGVPFVLAGAWYLVRSYRLQQELKRATGEAGVQRPAAREPGRPNGTRPRSSKRYTPPR
jgi:hypothetical protein